MSAKHLPNLPFVFLGKSQLRNLLFKSGGLLLAALLLQASFKANGQTYTYTPATLSGFNLDVVANGVGAATTSTTTDLGSMRALVSADFRAATGGTAPTYSLPANGAITSMATSGLTFQLAAYTSNNVLRMDTQGQNGTLTFATAKVATDVFILATAGEYDATIDVVVNFSDATSQTFTAVTIRDWYDGSTTNRATNGIGRINITNSGLEGDANNPHLYQLPLLIATGNIAKTISSVKITKTDPTVLVYPAVGGGVVAILGITTATIMPTSYVATGVTGFNFDLIANGVGAATASTNTDLGSTRALVSADFRATIGGAAPTYALPANGVINSAATTGMPFQLAAYTGNNALRMDTQGQNGMLTLSTPRAATDVYLLATAGEYDATVDVVVNFADATSQTFSAITIRDWYDGSTTNLATSGIGRINITNSGLEGDASNPHLYQLPLSIAMTNTNKLISSIKVTKTDPTVLVFPAVGGGVVAILAVSLKVSGSLPVSLTAFTGKKVNKEALLSWTTATEMNNTGFEVEGSTDGIHFTSLAFVASKAAGGNSSIPISYAITTALLTGPGSYYRLKQIDKDGKSSYTPTVFLKGDNKYNINLTGLYPNPVSSFASLRLNAEKPGKLTLLITDATGRTVSTQNLSVVAGSNRVRITTAALPAANYYLIAIAADGASNTIGFVVK